MTTPKFLYFDMGNVLLKFDHDQAARQIGELVGLSQQTVSEIVFDSDLQRRYESGELDSQGFYDEFCRRADCRPERNALMEAGSDIFQLNVTIVAIVAQLWRAGMQLGILSNTCEAHWQFIRRRQFAVIEDFFAVHALSYDLKAMKPAGEIYQRAVELAGVPAEEILFVDDRIENVEAARRSGIDAILFTSSGRLAADLRSRGLVFNY